MLIVEITILLYITASMPRIGPSPVPSIVTCLGRLPGLYSEKFFMIKVSIGIT